MDRRILFTISVLCLMFLACGTYVKALDFSEFGGTIEFGNKGGLSIGNLGGGFTPDNIKNKTSGSNVVTYQSESNDQKKVVSREATVFPSVEAALKNMMDEINKYLPSAGLTNQQIEGLQEYLQGFSKPHPQLEIPDNYAVIKTITTYSDGTKLIEYDVGEYGNFEMHFDPESDLNSFGFYWKNPETGDAFETGEFDLKPNLDSLPEGAVEGAIYIYLGYFVPDPDRPYDHGGWTNIWINPDGSEVTEFWFSD